LLTGVTAAGAGSDIGLQLHRLALASGTRASIALRAWHAGDDLAHSAELLEKAGARTRVIAAATSAQATLDAALDLYGGLDALVIDTVVIGERLAGTGTKLSLDLWDRVFREMVKESWLLARAAQPALVASHGAVVVVSPLAGVSPDLGSDVLSPASAALLMMTRVLGQELAGQGVRANIVSTPSPRLAKQSGISNADIAAAVAFLAGPDAGYLSGENLRVDRALSRRPLEAHQAGVRA
jgi:NAD(P)-dependent dehydrogenase (short-subunit alcohol dehydrogenase family)